MERLTFDFPVPVEPTMTIMGSLGGRLLDIVVIVRVATLKRRCIATTIMIRHGDHESRSIHDDVCYKESLHSADSDDKVEATL